MYNKQKANGALTREKMQKKYTGLKLQSIVSEKRKLREVVRKRDSGPLDFLGYSTNRFP